jgi:hypothetical protein
MELVSNIFAPVKALLGPAPAIRCWQFVLIQFGAKHLCAFCHEVESVRPKSLRILCAIKH